MEYQNFDCEIAEGCATVSMIGPGSPQLADLHDEFVDLFLRLQEDRAVRVILFTDGDHAFELHHLQDEVAEAQIEGGGLEILAAQEEVSRKIVTLAEHAERHDYVGRNYHIDPHPRFVSGDRYVVFTTTILGEIDVALVPVAALLEHTQ